MDPQDVLALASRLESTFDPGGNLPDDCEAWAEAHADVIEELRGLAECALMDDDEDYSPAARAPRAPLEPHFDDWASDIASERENMGLDGYTAYIEGGLRKAYAAGLAAARSALPSPQRCPHGNTPGACSWCDLRDDGGLPEAAALPRVPEPDLSLEIIVNGKPVSVTAGPIRDVIEQAIVRAGMFGAPIDQWELRTREGDVIPHALPGGVEFALMGGQRLFLNLGLPPAMRASRADELTAPRVPEPDRLDEIQRSPEFAAQEQAIYDAAVCLTIDQALDYASKFALRRREAIRVCGCPKAVEGFELLWCPACIDRELEAQTFERLAAKSQVRAARAGAQAPRVDR